MRDGLPFINVQLLIKQQIIVVDNVLIDSGSASSLFSVDYLSDFGIAPESHDQIRKMVGIGGHEYVFEKKISSIKINELIAKNITIQI
jgi:phosphoglycolate phosphatase-like HAD superfamily hydrolase